MGALLEIGANILSQAGRRAEVSAQNISNITTPGYKRRINFDKLIGSTDPLTPQIASQSTSVDFSAGKQIETGNPHDLAISGNGFFTVRSDEGLLYTRQGQFSRDADGHLITAQGFTLQTEGGADLVVRSGPFEVTADGVVVQDGAPVAKLALVDITDLQAAAHGEGGLFSAPDELVAPAAGASVRQGALESSNVSTADEMVALMAAVRRAETGQRVISVYDDLMGRALTAFGQA